MDPARARVVHKQNDTGVVVVDVRDFVLPFVEVFRILHVTSVLQDRPVVHEGHPSKPYPLSTTRTPVSEAERVRRVPLFDTLFVKNVPTHQFATVGMSRFNHSFAQPYVVRVVQTYRARLVYVHLFSSPKEPDKTLCRRDWQRCILTLMGNLVLSIFPGCYSGSCSL